MIDHVVFDMRYHPLERDGFKKIKHSRTHGIRHIKKILEDKKNKTG